VLFLYLVLPCGILRTTHLPLKFAHGQTQRQKRKPLIFVPAALHRRVNGYTAGCVCGVTGLRRFLRRNPVFDRGFAGRQRHPVYARNFAEELCRAGKHSANIAAKYAEK